MIHFVRAPLFILIATIAVAPLAAQDIQQMDQRPTRSGFWWGVGIGRGRTSIACRYCTAGPETFPMLQLSAGTALGRHFAIGVQAGAGGKHDAYNGPSDNTATFGDANVSAYWYPLSREDLWFQGGVGRVLWRVTKDPVDTNTYHAVANSLTAGVGYDIRLRRGLSITPSIRGIWGRKGSLVDEQTHFTQDVDWQTTIVDAGVSIVWH